jgi:hypothetical protein
MRKIGLLAAAIAIALPAYAQQSPALPPTNLSCEDFQKNPDGTWTVVKAADFMFAGLPMKVHVGDKVTATSFFSDNYALIDTLNAKCGGK